MAQNTHDGPISQFITDNLDHLVDVNSVPLTSGELTFLLSGLSLVVIKLSEPDLLGQNMLVYMFSLVLHAYIGPRHLGESLMFKEPLSGDFC